MIKIYKSAGLWYYQRDFNNNTYTPHQVLCGKGFWRVVTSLFKLYKANKWRT